ncbi:hypothetical protein EW145_g3572 [Phellinidium pouzarii]|uniref:ATP-dependent RNA helicase n=1 Tax=Phellinidium pouzarii TaxID=167371 RepID=A0A4S4L6W5_9AGAM|nr:hypothetical protein EW145_g3572 [Phellinidium pouzarii]
MAVAVPQPADAQKTGKTKAKARYLKKKKERRKHRKADAAQLKQSVPAPAPVAEAAPDSDDPSESSDDDEVVPVVAKDKEPPRKRRKTDVTDSEDEEGLAISSFNEDIALAENDAPHARSPTPTAAFPSFPLPVVPDAPSKRTLALQGLDKALLGAEIVDPTRTMSVNALDADRQLIAGAGELQLIGEKMRKRLRDLGINELFAVQTALLPFLLPPQRHHRALYCPYDPPRDVCASAPTGSGKTLAYVIPIVEILSSRIVTRLRALVVLPTRDLVVQVQETFEAISKGRGLKIGVATGQHSFAHEQAQFVGAINHCKLISGGTSKVDILICTPGRLIDHLTATPGFTLQHLRFLVIDEADRLLAQSFQDWLAQVLAALRPSTRPIDEGVSEPSLDPSITSPTHSPTSTLSSTASTLTPILYHDAVAPSFLPHIATDLDDPKHTACQKLLFSATLTRDPARIAALGLRDAKYFIVQGSGGEGDDTAASMLGSEEFAMPAALKEHYITMTSSHKPLILFYLVHARGVSNALVFTKSAASTARLVTLFGFFEEAYSTTTTESEAAEPKKRIIAQAYSSDLAPSERKTILEKFKKQEIDILICSDLVARGLDIPHVAHVVSYDAPVDLRKYVHRAGRTARAGCAGDAWTLVEDQEARFFKEMLRGAGPGRFEQVVRIALAKLKEAYSRTGA